jgi:hypothetical protein
LAPVIVLDPTSHVLAHTVEHLPPPKHPADQQRHSNDREDRPEADVRDQCHDTGDRRAKDEGSHRHESEHVKQLRRV